MLYGLERIAAELQEWDVDAIFASQPATMSLTDYILALTPMTLVSLELFNIITNNGIEDEPNDAACSGECDSCNVSSQNPNVIDIDPAEQTLTNSHSNANSLLISTSRSTTSSEAARARNTCCERANNQLIDAALGSDYADCGGGSVAADDNLYGLQAVVLLRLPLWQKLLRFLERVNKGALPPGLGAAVSG